VSTCGENVAAGLALDEVLNGIVAGAQGAERRMVPGHVIKATPHTADGTAFAISGKSLVHRRAGSKIKEVLRSPDMILRSRPDAVENGRVDGICAFVYGGVLRQKKQDTF